MFIIVSGCGSVHGCRGDGNVLDCAQSFYCRGRVGFRDDDELKLNQTNNYILLYRIQI